MRQTTARIRTDSPHDHPFNWHDPIHPCRNSARSACFHTQSSYTVCTGFPNRMISPVFADPSFPSEAKTPPPYNAPWPNHHHGLPPVSTGSPWNAPSGFIAVAVLILQFREGIRLMLEVPPPLIFGREPSNSIPSS